MDLHRWWQADPLERYWMEITGRPDLGADLHAPRLDDSGEENPTYALVREVQDGDIVLHYEKRVDFGKKRPSGGRPAQRDPAAHRSSRIPEKGSGTGFMVPSTWTSL